MSTVRIGMTARLSPEAEPPGFDVNIEVDAAGMSDAAKAEVAERLVARTVDVLGRVTAPVLQLPGDPLPRDARL